MITWQNITVGQYQDIYTLLQSDIDPLDKELQAIALLTNSTVADIEALTLDRYKALRTATAWIFSSLPTGKPIKRWGKYKLIRRVQDLDTGRYISMQSFLQMDMIANLHNLTACIIVPRWGKYNADNHEQYANDCKQMPFIAVYQTMVFFCKVFADTMKALHPYLETEISKAIPTNSHSSQVNLSEILDGLQTLAGLPSLNETV